jgi:hypothetical protein
MDKTLVMLGRSWQGYINIFNGLNTGGEPHLTL